MPRVRHCTLLSLAEPFGSELYAYPPVPPIVPYTDERVRRALQRIRVQQSRLVVGDGTHAAYADVYSCSGSSITLGMLIAGPFVLSTRVYALALAHDIVTRMCGAPCSAWAICCEAGGVRCVPLPVELIVEAKRLVRMPK